MCRGADEAEKLSAAHKDALHVKEQEYQAVQQKLQACPFSLLLFNSQYRLFVTAKMSCLSCD